MFLTLSHLLLFSRLKDHILTSCSGRPRRLLLVVCIVMFITAAFTLHLLILTLEPTKLTESPVDKNKLAMYISTELLWLSKKSGKDVVDVLRAPWMFLSSTCCSSSFISCSSQHLLSEFSLYISSLSRHSFTESDNYVDANILLKCILLFCRFASRIIH